MKLLLMMMLLTFAASDAFAVDFRWTSGFGQGTLEANIENGNGSSVNIYCPAGQEDQTPGMFIQVKGINAQRDELVTVQIIVDGKNYPFDLKEIRFRADSRTNRWEFRELLRALASSKQRSFVIEFPKYNVAETFSLLDARKAIGRGKLFVLNGCDDGS
jgi:hypothetical protein